MPDNVEIKRTCKGICKKYKVKKPAGAGRYESGQGRCQTCDIWIDHNGCHIKDGSPAGVDDRGWFCNCCNFRIRRHPRNLKYKEKLYQNNPKKYVDKTSKLIDQTEKNSYSKNSTYWEKVEKESKKMQKLFGFNHTIESSKENEGNLKFFEGINDLKNNVKEDYNIENECEILIKNYKKQSSISEHNVKLMEDMIYAYDEIGSLKELCQQAELDISIVRRDFRNLSRVPTELRELVINDKLIADPILAIEIAVYATDYFEWDQDENNTIKVVILAKNIAQKFKDVLELRREFFATKDDYSKPINASTKKNDEIDAILKDWPVKKSRFEFNGITDRTGRQYDFIVKFSKDPYAVRFLRRWEYEKGRRILKQWAWEMIDQIKNQGNAKEFAKEHSNEFND